MTDGARLPTGTSEASIHPRYDLLALKLSQRGQNGEVSLPMISAGVDLLAWASSSDTSVAEDSSSSIRTRRAPKRKDIRLGNPPLAGSIEAAREAREDNVAKQHKLVLPIIKGLQASGIST